jgi:hypothetical protein
VLQFGAKPKGSTLRRLLAEACAGQDLRRHVPPPVAAEPEEYEEYEEYRPAPGIQESLLFTTTVELWLLRAPGGGLEPGYRAARSASRALSVAWASTAVHALAAGPLTLDELHGALVGSLGRETLLEYVIDLESSGLVEPLEGESGEVRYAVTDWLREGVAPLAAAAWLDLRSAESDAAPPDELDVGAAFLLTLPLLRLPEDVSGACRLGVDVGRAAAPRAIGVTVRIEAGRVVAIEPGLDDGARAWAAGSSQAWLDALISREVQRVRTGGDELLVRSVLAGLHERLFSFTTERDGSVSDPLRRG